MNVGGMTSRGQAQDPLNFLQRTIARSPRFDPTTKRHVMLQIRKAKAEVRDYEQAVSERCRLWSYAQMLRLEALLDTLEETDKGYKTAFWSRCKASEDYRRYLSRSKMKPVNGNGSRGAQNSALWQGPKSSPVPHKADADTT